MKTSALKKRLFAHLPDSFFRSDFWRKRLIRSYMESHATAKLQIGSGWNGMTGWLNTDIDPQWCRAGALYLDAGKPFPFPDASFDYVYSEHLFEHLNHDQAVNMLNECRRILKPEGAIRIATPDFHFLTDLYLHPEKPVNRRYVEWASQGGGGGGYIPVPEVPLYVINKFHTEWGHQIIYDQDTLMELLKEHGFRNPRICETGKSDIVAFQNLEAHFRHMPYEFYELETMILEADR